MSEKELLAALLQEQIKTNELLKQLVRYMQAELEMYAPIDLPSQR